MEAAGTMQRPRIKVACEECRKNKRKCEGQRPTCSLCGKAGKLCLYAAEISRKRKYYEEGYIQDLEDKVKALELLLERERRAKGTSSERNLSFASMRHELQNSITDEYEDHPYRTQSSNSHSLQPITDRPNPEDVVKYPRSHVAMEDLASLMLKMDIKDRGEPSFTIPSAQNRFISPRLRRSNFRDSTSPKSGIAQEFSLPPEVRQLLIQSFLQNFNTFHQFVNADETSILIARKGRYTELDEEFRDYALFAIGGYFSSDREVRDFGRQCAVFAESIALQCIRERPSDLAVQGLSMLSWRELMLPNDSMAYNYIAMATGLILHLGLHVRDLGKTPASIDASTDAVLLQRQIRSFWAYFSVDRMVTSSLGMNCTIHWQRVRIRPYITVIDGEPSLDDIAHDSFCQLWHLWDTCMDQVYAFGWIDLSTEERQKLLDRSHQALTRFFAKADSRLSLKSDYMPDNAVLFQLAYHTALLLIHRPFLNEPRGSATLDFALRSATSAAASISRIIRSYRKFSGFSNVAPQIIDYILSAAVIHLLNATSGRELLGRQSANSLRSCLVALSDMRSKWKAKAERSIRQIQELAHRWKVGWALPLHLSQPLSMPSTPGQILHEEVSATTQDTPIRGPEFDVMDFDPIYYDPTTLNSDFMNDLGNVWDPYMHQGTLKASDLLDDGPYSGSLEWLFCE